MYATEAQSYMCLELSASSPDGPININVSLKYISE